MTLNELLDTAVGVELRTMYVREKVEEFTLNGLGDRLATALAGLEGADALIRSAIKARRLETLAMLDHWYSEHRPTYHPTGGADVYAVDRSRPLQYKRVKMQHDEDLDVLVSVPLSAIAFDRTVIDSGATCADPGLCSRGLFVLLTIAWATATTSCKTRMALRAPMVVATALELASQRTGNEGAVEVHDAEGVTPEQIETALCLWDPESDGAFAKFATAFASARRL